MAQITAALVKELRERTGAAQNPQAQAVTAALNKRRNFFTNNYLRLNNNWLCTIARARYSYLEYFNGENTLTF